MPRAREILGSLAGQISQSDLASVGRGLLIAVGGALAAEITKQLTGAHFVINWQTFHVGPLDFAAGSYDYTLLVWAAWSAAINFARKWATDTRYKPL